MAAASSTHGPITGPNPDLARLDHLPERITLLELVYAISAITDDDQVVIDTVISMLARGRVQLRGNFRDARAQEFEI